MIARYASFYSTWSHYASPFIIILHVLCPTLLQQCVLAAQVNTKSYQTFHIPCICMVSYAITASFSCGSVSQKTTWTSPHGSYYVPSQYSLQWRQSILFRDILMLFSCQCHNEYFKPYQIYWSGTKFNCITQPIFLVCQLKAYSVAILAPIQS